MRAVGQRDDGAVRGATGSWCSQQPVGICVLVTPVELPGGDGHPQDRARAGGRLHRRPQAGQRHPADRAGDGRDPRRGRRAGRAWSTCCRRAAPAPSSRRCCTTRGCASCRSPARPRSAGCCCKEAADQVVNCSMELGGNAPFLVFADADLDAALDGAMVAKMRNGGRGVHRGQPVLRRAPIAEEFSRRLAERMAALRGRARRSTTATQVGPAGQRGHRRQGRRAGAAARWPRAPTAVVGGRRPDRPGLLLRADRARRRAARARRSSARRSSARSRRSSSSTTEDEAIRLANDTEYGLVSYVYTGDLARGLRVSEAHGGGDGRA